MRRKKTESKKRKRTVRFAEVDLNEDESEHSDTSQHASDDDNEDVEEEGEDDEFFDVLDILDGHKSDHDGPYDGVTMGC